MPRLHKYILAHESLMRDKTTTVICPICGERAEPGQMREIFWCNHCESTVEDAVKAVYPKDHWDELYNNHVIAIAFVGEKAIGELGPIRRTGGGGCNVRISFLAPFGEEEITKAEMEAAEWEFLPWWQEYQNAE